MKVRIQTSTARLLFGLILSAVIPIGFVNCSKSSSPTTAAPPGQSFDDLKITELGAGTYSLQKNFNYKLLKLESLGEAPAYAQWIPSGRGQEGPVVLIADPYSGIGWADLDLDKKWATRPNASTGYFHKDEDGPAADSSAQTIFYQLSTPETSASQGAYFLLNNISVLIVHGRYYAGGDLMNEIHEMNLGLRFLAQQAEVDPARIGIFGISWGGFEALYGSTHAPQSATPIAGVAVAPLSDFSQHADYLQQTLPASISNSSVLSGYQDFFEPYLRRIFATTGGAPGAPGSQYENFNASYLASNLKTSFLIIHDQWDTLIPYQQTQTLQALRPDKIEAFYYPHLTTIDYNTFARDHQQPNEGMTFNSFYPVSLSYLLNRLLTSSERKTIYYSNSEFSNSLIDLRQKQQGGVNIDWLKPRLLEFCAPNLYLEDTTSGQSVTGAYYLSVIMTAWGWSESDSTVCEYLKTHSL